MNTNNNERVSYELTKSMTQEQVNEAYGIPASGGANLVLNIKEDPTKFDLDTMIGDPMICWLRGDIAGSEMPFMGIMRSDEPDRVYYMRSPSEWQTQQDRRIPPTFEQMALPQYRLLTEIQYFVYLPYQQEKA